MFRALLAHPQEALTQTALGILRACYVSWMRQDCSGTLVVVQPTDIHVTRTQYTNCCLCGAS
jgi:hypothetical protein